MLAALAEIRYLLAYLGIKSEKLQKQLRRLLGRVAPWIKLCVVFKPVCKLQQLSKLKSLFPLLSNSGVVYKINCSECDTFYVGMTTRQIRQRMKEHSEDSKSAVIRHSMGCKHKIDFESPEILARDTFKSRLYVKEALKINELHAHRYLNGNVGSTEMKLW